MNRVDPALSLSLEDKPTYVHKPGSERRCSIKTLVTLFPSSHLSFELLDDLHA